MLNLIDQSLKKKNITHLTSKPVVEYDKSYYYISKDQETLHLNILSNIYPNLFFNLKLNENNSYWDVPNIDPFHEILHKILSKYNLLDININITKSESDKHVKNLIELIEILKIYNYCFNCADMLDFSNDSNFTSCDLEDCKNICNSRLLDNSITQEFQKYKGTPNETILDFIITTAYWTLESNRRNIIYTPIPKYIEIKAKEENNNSTIWTLLDIFIENFPIQKILKIIKNHDNDKDLFNEIKEIGYAFIKFTIKSNNTIIFSDNLISSTDIYTVVKHENVNDINIDKTIDNISEKLINMKQFNVVHPQNIENKFKKAKQTCYLYHGSRQENWYSIMRNGLKVGSTDNKLLVNGAVHGTGIYLSDVINFSLSYSNSPNIVIGVCQVMDNRDKWKKTTNIFVVPEESSVILKYLFVFPNDTLQKNGNSYISTSLLQVLDNKFQSGIYNDQSTKQTQVYTLRSKRLLKEYKTIVQQNPKELGFRVVLPKEDNLDLWKIYLQADDFTGNEIIQNDMKKYGIKEVEIEFKFNENYPVQPPFVRIVSPRFIYRTGHITIGGSICMELLTNQGWDITTSVSTVITYIKSAIMDGEGQIDPSGVNKSYTLNEAHDAFDRMLKSHGWI
jgi:ubiquitin-protein ligase